MGRGGRRAGVPEDTRCGGRAGRSDDGRSVARCGQPATPARPRPARRWRAYHAARHTTSLASQLPSLKLSAEDWAAAPVVSMKRVEEGMFVPGNHKPQIDLAALGGARGAGGAWRASGHAANCRSAAASAFLVEASGDGFQSAEVAWQGAAPPHAISPARNRAYPGSASSRPTPVRPGCVLDQVGLVFVDVRSERAYVSLGFASWSVLAWPLEELATSGARGDGDLARHFRLAGPPAGPELLACTAVVGNAPLQGLPVEVRAPAWSPGGLGITWQVAGPLRPLLEHALASTVNLGATPLKRFCLLVGAAPSRAPAKGRKDDWLRSLVRHMFPDADAAREVLERYSAAAEAEPAFTPDVVDALEALGEEGGKSFPDLKERLVDQVRRACCVDSTQRGRGGTLQRTPPGLRERVPGGGLLPGVYLCENALEQRYLAHYPLDGAALQSISRSWGPAAGRSQETAGDLALAWMWARHRQVLACEPGANEGAPGAAADLKMLCWCPRCFLLFVCCFVV